jgi:hypothetical protein
MHGTPTQDMSVVDTDKRQAKHTCTFRMYPNTYSGFEEVAERCHITRSSLANALVRDLVQGNLTFNEHSETRRHLESGIGTQEYLRDRVGESE